MQDIIECPINISEGRNQKLITEFVNCFLSEGCEVARVDSGEAANRTVITAFGTPLNIQQSVLNIFGVATKGVDISKNDGIYPCIGAIDICPFVPVGNTSSGVASTLALKTADLVAKEFNIPVFLYKDSATKQEHQNASYIRKGGIRNLEKRLKSKDIEADITAINQDNYIHPTLGATIIGKREILIAYNVTLKSKDTFIAKSIARQLREEFQFRSLKSIGWYIDEYELTQVSCNIEDTNKVDLYDVFARVCQLAQQMGVEVCGSEVIGLVPVASLESSYAKLFGSTPEESSPRGSLDEVINALNLELHQKFELPERTIEHWEQKLKFK